MTKLFSKTVRQTSLQMSRALFLPMLENYFSIHVPAIIRLASDTSIQNAESKNGNPHQNFGGTFRLEEIFAVADAGGGVFSCGLHFAQIPSRRTADFWLCLRTHPAD